jgi:hypothetical protein
MWVWLRLSSRRDRCDAVTNAFVWPGRLHAFVYARCRGPASVLCALRTTYYKRHNALADAVESLCLALNSASAALELAAMHEHERRASYLISSSSSRLRFAPTRLALESRYVHLSRAALLFGTLRTWAFLGEYFSIALARYGLRGSFNKTTLEQYPSGVTWDSAPSAASSVDSLILCFQEYSGTAVDPDWHRSALTFHEVVRLYVVVLKLAEASRLAFGCFRLSQGTYGGLKQALGKTCSDYVTHQALRSIMLRETWKVATVTLPVIMRPSDKFVRSGTCADDCLAATSDVRPETTSGTRVEGDTRGARGKG